MNLKSVTFDDEFNNFVSSPDGSQGWMTTYTFGGETSRTLPGNSEAQYYSDPSVGENPFSVSNGVLSITASSAAPGSNPYNLPYDSGVMTTNGSFSQLYGYFEVKAELPAGQGFWPAFWMLPVSGDYAAELDIFEVLGNSPTTVYETIHAPVGATQQTLNVADLSAGFHTYGVDWEPDYLTYYLDGQAVLKTVTPAAMKEPMYMLLNLAVGGNGSWPGAPDSTTKFPSALQIDYVRAYATASTTSVSGTAAIPAGSAASALTTLQSIAPIGASVVVGSGRDTIVLNVAEDPYIGNAQFTVSVDGVQIGGTQTTTVLRSSGAAQTFDIEGNFGAGTHVVSINLVNHDYGGTPSTSRNLYVEGATYNGTTVAGGQLNLLSQGAQSFTIAPVSGLVVVGSGSDTIALAIAEDAYQGNAQFTVSVDGVQIGGTQTATVLRSSGAQAFDIKGNFGAGTHAVSVNFLNDLYGGSATADRNLYVDGASYNGTAVANAGLVLLSQGAQSFTIPATGPVVISASGVQKVASGSEAQSFVLTGSRDTIVGGAGLLTVDDTRGTNVLMGGAGGLAATVRGSGDVILTQAGSASTLVLGATANVTSNGADSITGAGFAETILANGNATINGGTAANTYRLTGNSVLNSAGLDTVSIMGGSDTIRATGSAVTVRLASGTVQVTEAGGTDNETATVTGVATITGAAGRGGLLVSTGSNAATITLGGGSTTVTGTGALVIQGDRAPSSLTLAGAGMAATVSGMAGALTIAGSLMPLVEQTTLDRPGSAVKTSAVVTDGTRLLTLAGSRSAATIDGSQSVLLTGFYDTVTGTSGTLTVLDNRGFNTIVGGPGGLNVSATRGYDSITAAGSATVVLSNGFGNTVVGGAGLLTLTDTVGGNTVVGGSGGMAATFAGFGGTITTASGSSNRVTLGGANAVLRSNGTDTIVTGRGTSGSGSNTLNLAGVAQVTSTGVDVVNVLAGSATVTASGSSVTANVSGGTLLLTELGGGDNDVVRVSGAATVTGAAGRGGVSVKTASGGAGSVALGTGNNTVVSAGNDTISAGAGGLTVSASGHAVVQGGSGAVTLTAGSLGASFIAGTGTARVVAGAGAVDVTMGSGATSAWGGAGADIYRFAAGQGGGTDTIYNFGAGDRLSFSGFSGSAVASQVVSGGSLNVTLVDHTKIVLSGVTHQMSF